MMLKLLFLSYVVYLLVTAKMIRNICEELLSLICPLSLYPVREQYNWITIAYQNSFKLYSFHIINDFICLVLYNLEEMTVFKKYACQTLVRKFKFILFYLTDILFINAVRHCVCFEAVRIWKWGRILHILFLHWVANIS